MTEWLINLYVDRIKDLNQLQQSIPAQDHYWCEFFRKKYIGRNMKYCRLSLSQIPRDSLKYFEIAVLRHIRFVELRKN